MNEKQLQTIQRLEKSLIEVLGIADCYKTACRDCILYSFDCGSLNKTLLDVQRALKYSTKKVKPLDKKLTVLDTV